MDASGIDLSDLELLVWQIGDNDSNEIMGNPSVSFEADVNDGCLAWQDSGSLAGWMNNNTPNGVSAFWFLDANGDICADVPIGTGALFGLLRTCDDQVANPTVV